jgi:hypothetical protein
MLQNLMKKEQTQLVKISILFAYFPVDLDNNS